jgi:hypothetical protein
MAGHTDPRVPDGLAWFQHELTWQQIAEGRQEFGLRDFELVLRYEDDYGVNAGLKVAASGVGLDMGGQFEDHEATAWRIVGRFRSADD